MRSTIALTLGLLTGLAASSMFHRCRAAGPHHGPPPRAGSWLGRCFAAAPVPDRPERPAPQAAAPAPKQAAWALESRWRITREDAEQDVLEEARARIVREFDLHPTAEKLRPLLRNVEEEKKDFGTDIGVLLRVHAQVEVAAKDLRQFEAAEQGFRKQQRMLALAKALAGVVVVLLVVAVYFRLEESTKGYLTGVLRLAAAGLIAVAGAGWWLLR